jgi:hypothetical protein
MNNEDQAQLRVRSEQLDYNEDGLYCYEGKPFTGIEVFEKNGWLQGEHELRQGVKWGRQRSWHRPGVPEEEAECAWGGYHGSVRKWHWNGQLALEGDYEHGIRVRAKEWDEEGKLTDDYTIQPTDSWCDTLQMYRCFYGDPRRPFVADPAWLAWNDGMLVKMAQAIFDDKAADRMPILADALIDAGCTNQYMLQHCRAGVHVPCCWVLGVLLGKGFAPDEV